MRNREPDESGAGRGGADLVDLFSDEQYGFRMRMRRRSIRDYFRLSPEADAVLSERRRWLETQPECCFAFSSEGYNLAREAVALLSAEGVVHPSLLPNELGADGQFLAASRQLEPDLVLLRPDATGSFLMVAGAVCFPSSWSLGEKMGRPLHEIHAPVPGLNERLGLSISHFLRRMSAGGAWCRENWGLSSSPELNQHPSRMLPRLAETVMIDRVWLRVERQALVVLPETHGILFAIRVEVSPLGVVAAHAGCRTGLRRALETMPEPVARYKGLGIARRRLIALLS